MIEVRAPGLLTSPQDTGRIGHAHLGIGRSGAVDRPAMQLANALVGNRTDACVLELTLLGPRLRLDREHVIALTGAPLPQARCQGKQLPAWRPVSVPAGSEIELGAMPAGCRSYLAVAGGFDMPPWLGSRSADLNARVGPLQGRALQAGDRLHVDTPERLPTGARGWSLDPRHWFDPPMATRPLRLLPGSHTHVLDADSRTALTGMPFRVSADSNRVGVRLDAASPLHLAQAMELISEGLVPGVMQLPPGGQPIVLLNEHPVTGGYPRVAQLAAVDLPRLAQCRPGDTLHFTWITPDQARDLREHHRRSLRCLFGNIARRLEYAS